MTKLILVTLIWAFSFSLIGVYLRGVDASLIAFLRACLALICFLPFMKFKRAKLSLAAEISAIGAIQIGLMSIFYYKSFDYLKVYEIAIFTIFTPFYVTLFYDAFKLRFRALYLLSVSVAVLGALVIRFKTIDGEFLVGFLYVQGANLCFAFGQSVYKFLLEKANSKDQRELFGYFFVGAGIITFLIMLSSINLSEFSIKFIENGLNFNFSNEKNFNMSLLQAGIIFYLGVIASALGYFLWNKGACEVDSGILAIMNNALIPAAILVNLIFWGKDITMPELIKLIIGSSLMVISIFMHKRIVKYYARKSLAI